ncbi:hypothetical protein, partial [Chromobacterium violaceum]|uniref:hypothetical protein n=1 Tax=Chromobacterium violaceum TaxID=536 RepID=UPI000B3194CD
LALLPLLSAAVAQHWPDMPSRSVLAAQVEQESGWRERAVLKTSREYGAGLGQFTKAYRADGGVRFDAIREMAARHPELRGWNWGNAFDPRYQLTAMVLKNRDNYRLIRLGELAQPGAVFAGCLQYRPLPPAAFLLHLRRQHRAGRHVRPVLSHRRAQQRQQGQCAGAQPRSHSTPPITTAAMNSRSASTTRAAPVG